MSVDILMNQTLLEDLNRRLPVLGPRLFEINKSVAGSDETLAYIWDQMVKFFLGNQTTITTSNQHGFIDVSNIHTGCSCVSALTTHEIGFCVTYYNLKNHNYGENTKTPFVATKGHSVFQMLSDRSFIHGIHKSAQLHNRVGHPDLFLYHFNYRGLYSFTTVFANTTMNFGQSQQVSSSTQQLKRTVETKS